MTHLRNFCFVQVVEGGVAQGLTVLLNSRAMTTLLSLVEREDFTGGYTDDNSVVIALEFNSTVRSWATTALQLVERSGF